MEEPVVDGVFPQVDCELLQIELFQSSQKKNTVSSVHTAGGELYGESLEEGLGLEVSGNQVEQLFGVFAARGNIKKDCAQFVENRLFHEENLFVFEGVKMGGVVMDTLGEEVFSLLQLVFGELVALGDGLNQNVDGGQEPVETSVLQMVDHLIEVVRVESEKGPDELFEEAVDEEGCIFDLRIERVSIVGAFLEVGEKEAVVVLLVANEEVPKVDALFVLLKNSDQVDELLEKLENLVLLEVLDDVLLHEL